MENSYITTVEVRWSDLDPNFHVRHSVYYDFGAFCRINFLDQRGLTTSFMTEHFFGPILFREECIFRKEIRLGDKISLDLSLVAAREDYSRWTIQHNIFKNGDTVAAVLTVDGAWINTKERKLTRPPEKALQVFSEMKKAQAFSWIN